MTALLSFTHISPLQLFSICVHSPCLHTVTNLHTAAAIQPFAYPFIIQHFTQFLSTALLCSSNSLTQLPFSHLFIHMYFFYINHSFFTSSLSLIHSLLLLSCFFSFFFFYISHASLSHSRLLSTLPLLSAASPLS